MSIIILPSRSSNECVASFAFHKNAKQYAETHGHTLVLAKKIDSRAHSKGTYEFWVFKNLEKFVTFFKSLPQIHKTFCLILSSSCRCFYMDIDVELKKETNPFVNHSNKHIISLLHHLRYCIEKKARESNNTIKFKANWKETFVVWNASRERLCDFKISLHIVNQNIFFKDLSTLIDVVTFCKSIRSCSEVTDLLSNGIDTSPYHEKNQFWRLPGCHNGEPGSFLKLVCLQTAHNYGISEQIQLNLCDKLLIFIKLFCVECK